MAKTVVLVGALGEPTFEPDISRSTVAAAGGGDLEHFRVGEHKDEAMKAMASGLAHVVRQLYDMGKLDGIIGMGGRFDHGRHDRRGRGIDAGRSARARAANRGSGTIGAARTCSSFATAAASTSQSK